MRRLRSRRRREDHWKRPVYASQDDNERPLSEQTQADQKLSVAEKQTVNLFISSIIGGIKADESGVGLDQRWSLIVVTMAMGGGGGGWYSCTNPFHIVSN